MENALAIVEDLCRLCLDVPGVDNMFTPLDLTEDIFNILGVKVHFSDGLPQSLCKNCFNVINNAKKLRLISQKNDARMKYLLGETCSNNDEQEGNEVMSNSSITVRNGGSLEADDGSGIESDVTYESLLKRKKRKCKSSTSDENTQYPYKCDNCSKSFPTRKKLTLHSKVHNKTIVCPLDTCEKAFACKNDLKKHVRSHTGEKPYGCNICDRKFTQKCQLRLHRERIHYEYDYSNTKTKVKR